MATGPPVCLSNAPLPLHQHFHCQLGAERHGCSGRQVVRFRQGKAVAASFCEDLRRVCAGRRGGLQAYSVTRNDDTLLARRCREYYCTSSRHRTQQPPQPSATGSVPSASLSGYPNHTARMTPQPRIDTGPINLRRRLHKGLYGLQAPSGTRTIPLVSRRSRE